MQTIGLLFAMPTIAFHTIVHVSLKMLSHHVLQHFFWNYSKKMLQLHFQTDIKIHFSY